MAAKGKKKATRFLSASLPEDRLLVGVDVGSIKARILEKLGKPTSSRKLHQAAGAGVSRVVFEKVLDEMSSSGEIVSTQETFEKDGETIAWRKIALPAAAAA